MLNVFSPFDNELLAVDNLFFGTAIQHWVSISGFLHGQSLNLPPHGPAFRAPLFSSASANAAVETAVIQVIANTVAADAVCNRCRDNNNNNNNKTRKGLGLG